MRNKKGPLGFVGRVRFANVCASAMKLQSNQAFFPRETVRTHRGGLIRLELSCFPGGRDTAIQDVAHSHAHAGMPKGAASPSMDRSDPLPGNGYTTWPERANAQFQCDDGSQNIGNTGPSGCNLLATMNGRATACAAERAKMPSEVGKGAQQFHQRQQRVDVRRAGSGKCVHRFQPRRESGIFKEKHHGNIEAKPARRPACTAQAGRSGESSRGSVGKE